MNKYAELKKKHQKELNKLPMKAAFGKEQFKRVGAYHQRRRY